MVLILWKWYFCVMILRSWCAKSLLIIFPKSKLSIDFIWIQGFPVSRFKLRHWPVRRVFRWLSSGEWSLNHVLPSSHLDRQVPAKYWIYKFVNWVFFHSQKNEQWNRSWRLLTASEGMMLFPAVLLVVYFDLPLPSAFVYTIFIIILTKILIFYKSFTIFFSQSTIHLQIILYFCALELMPAVASWGILEMIASYLNVNF